MLADEGTSANMKTHADYESVITVIASSQDGFHATHVFDDVACGDLAMKILDEDDEDFTVGFKVTVKNLSTQRKEVYVSVEGLDSEGFVLDTHTISGKVNPGEVRSLSVNNYVSRTKFAKIVKWRIEDIT